MGFFDWVMRGIGFESEEEDDETNSIKKQESQQKPDKMSKRELKAQRAEAKKAFKYEKKYGVSLSKTATSDNKKTSSIDSYSSPVFSESKSFGGGGLKTSSGGFGDGLPTNVGGYGAKNFVFFKPKNYDDVTNLVEFMKQGEPAIINLDDISSDDAQRTLDFISGAVCALSGNIKRVSGNIFLIAPEGYNITKSE